MEYSMDKLVEFDVLINDEGECEQVAPWNTEFLGIFSNVPHGGDNNTNKRLAMWKTNNTDWEKIK